jgi:hypothetical protein
MNGSNIEVIAAVNLPMLVKLASVRETSSLEQAVIQAKEAGRKYICVASQVLDATPDRVEMPFDQVAIRNHDHSEGSVMVSVTAKATNGDCKNVSNQPRPIISPNLSIPNSCWRF